MHIVHGTTGCDGHNTRVVTQLIIHNTVGVNVPTTSGRSQVSQVSDHAVGGETSVTDWLTCWRTNFLAVVPLFGVSECRWFSQRAAAADAVVAVAAAEARIPD